jgi:hypothetical protein
MLQNDEDRTSSGRLEMATDLNLERVKANVAKAETEDLLDRATVYRNGMEPAALDLIDAELRARGVGEAELAAHREKREGTLYAPDGLALKCGLPRCPRPAVARRWGWNRGWGLNPYFPRPQPYCAVHLPQRWWFRLSD